ncbi:uncharacterized protein LOC143178354 [Calliopsis andreniformis]|uniref:uncharacterized protein LOC143178354 n=1 Tax=Calliopsis andreniformis TaxID=337506 RepID=UPI003FCE628D
MRTEGQFKYKLHSVTMYVCGIKRSTDGKRKRDRKEGGCQKEESPSGVSRRFRRVGSIFIAAIRRLEAECRRARGLRGNGSSAGNTGVQTGVVGTIGGRRYR